MNFAITAVIVLAALQVSSPAFKNNDYIPSRYTCEGENLSPELRIDGVPPNAKTLAITVFDPDGGTSGVVHWLQWNIAASAIIPENIKDGVLGNNVTGKPGFTGPCPPTGVHHYHFMVYALDDSLAIPQNSSKTDLENAMKGHILAKGELVGLYKKVKQ